MPSHIIKNIYWHVLIFTVTSRMQGNSIQSVTNFCICNANIWVHRKIPERYIVNDLIYVVVYELLNSSYLLTSYLYFQPLILVFTMNTYCFCSINPTAISYFLLKTHSGLYKALGNMLPAASFQFIEALYRI